MMQFIRGMKKHKPTIEEIRELAESRGGKCLSEQYVNSGIKLHWQCAKGHDWWTVPGVIKGGFWCAACSGNKRLTIEEMQELAESRGGKCLSERYINSEKKLHWQCAEGHEWWATPHAVKTAKTWCPVCGGSFRLDIMQMQKLAESRGGKCLSDKYVNNKTKLLWQCTKGHKWEAKPDDIIGKGSWCSICAAGTGERICRAFFEQLFDKPFPKIRPVWLKNNRGNRMELDGYNDELQLAFEHQGKQHYSLAHMYMTTEERLRQRVSDDELKKQLCSNREITLLQIPSIPSLLPLTKVKQFIKDECLAKGIKLPYDFDEKEVVLGETYNQKYLKEIQLIAESYGGTVLSNTFIHSNEKIHFKCAKGHEWWAVAPSIKRGIWCAACSGNLRRTIEEMKEIAESHGGKCLSEEYVNGNTKLHWRCAKGHEWWAVPNDIRHKGTWCSACSRVLRLTIEEMQELAESRVGECLSEKYVNSRTKLHWRCAKGHEWWAKPLDVKHSGTWCRICSKRALGTIEEMQELAESRGGKCLSEKYVNSGTKLHWQCKEGHEWWATPRSIKHGGSWCLICSGSLKLTIEEMRQIAESRGGKCLSEKYVNSGTKLHWQCREGHEWWAMPVSVRNHRTWCKVCHYKGRRAPNPQGT